MARPEYQSSVFARAQAHHRAALRADQVVGGDADRPAQPRGLADHLVQRVHVLRAADARDRLHVRAPLEQLHGEDDRAQLQQLLQFADDLGPIMVRTFGHPASSLVAAKSGAVRRSVNLSRRGRRPLVLGRLRGEARAGVSRAARHRPGRRGRPDGRPRRRPPAGAAASASIGRKPAVAGGAQALRAPRRPPCARRSPLPSARAGSPASAPAACCAAAGSRRGCAGSSRGFQRLRSHSVSKPNERLLMLAEPMRSRTSSMMVSLACTMMVRPSVVTGL